MAENKWVTGFITLLIGAITPFTTSMAPLLEAETNSNFITPEISSLNISPNFSGFRIQKNLYHVTEKWPIGPGLYGQLRPFKWVVRKGVQPYDHLTNKRITSPTTRWTKPPPKVILLSCKPCSPDSGGWLGHGVELIYWWIDWIQSFGNHQSIDSNDLIRLIWLIHCLVDCFIWADVIWLIEWWVLWLMSVFDLIWFDWFIDCHCFTSLSLILDLSSVCL